MPKIRSRAWDIVLLLVFIGAIFFVGSRFLSIFGPVTAGWNTNFERAAVDLDEIISGGVGRDGISPIDNPRFDDVASASWLQPQSPVIALEVNGDARAYPLAILTRHEIVNDDIGGVPVAVTFCPLCNSAIVFDRRVDGQVLRFGVSGNLRNSDLIMWDDKTESWWQQITGEAIVGEYTGRLLDIVPSQLVGFRVFAERFPAGKVLAGSAGDLFSNYGTNPYVGYDSSSSPFLFKGQVDPRLHATERVLAGIVDGRPIAYPYQVLSRERVINDQIGGVPVVAFWLPGATSALDRAEIDRSRDTGMSALFKRELNGNVLTFRSEGDRMIDDQTKSEWNIFGEAVSGQLQGERLERIDAFPHFWFAWAAFQPDTIIYGQ